jgi:hypothetical protein
MHTGVAGDNGITENKNCLRFTTFSYFPGPMISPRTRMQLMSVHPTPPQAALRLSSRSAQPPPRPNSSAGASPAKAGAGGPQPDEDGRPPRLTTEIDHDQDDGGVEQGAAVSSALSEDGHSVKLAGTAEAPAAALGGPPPSARASTAVATTAARPAERERTDADSQSPGDGEAAAAAAAATAAAVAEAARHARPPSASTGLRASSSVSRACPSWDRSIVTEIYLCHACSCQETEDGNARAGSSPYGGATRAPCVAVGAQAAAGQGVGRPIVNLESQSW